MNADRSSRTDRKRQFVAAHVCWAHGVLLRTSKPIAGEIVSKRGEIENGKP
jgi:hypothetical protein